jgi:hypothetical protein
MKHGRPETDGARCEQEHGEPAGVAQQDQSKERAGHAQWQGVREGPPVSHDTDNRL